MKEINLEEILVKWISYNLQQSGKSKEASDAVAKASIKGGSHWYILEAMKEACKQVIELAAENGKLNVYKVNMDNSSDNEFLIEEEYSHGDYNSNGKDYHVSVQINTESIINTINQVK